jgi:dipeptidase
MTQGLAAAPWGLPVRFDPEQAYKGSVPGNWERPIGLFRTVYSWVAQLRPVYNQSVGSVFYWAPHTPLGATYVRRACMPWHSQPQSSVIY